MQEICLISDLAFGITQPLNVFVIMERLGLAKEKAQGFAAAEGIGMLIGGGIGCCFNRIRRKSYEDHYDRLSVKFLL
ncbi:hypothetical protein C2I06_23325 [Niallia circulans]|uniref:hypothetical protein n=1 Tax=Niallia circulans TaxID=1397 RepID=UPI000F45BB42|nr:hypothetical protein [Niallia circulans]AYV69531.1 hypothetical protein C2I06_23325 [Niallia circulans]